MQEAAALPGVLSPLRTPDPHAQEMTGTAGSMRFLINGANSRVTPWNIAELFHSTQRRVMQAVSGRLLGPGAVLDIGCGTGRLSARLQQARPEMRVVGLESSRRVVAGCRRRTTLDVRRALIEEFPHRDGSFDAVMSSMSFHRWTDKPAALCELARRLRPGGVLALADLSDDDLMEHARLKILLGPFTSQMASLADRHQWLELAGLRLLYTIPTVMDRNVFMTVAERPLACDSSDRTWTS